MSTALTSLLFLGPYLCLLLLRTVSLAVFFPYNTFSVLQRAFWSVFKFMIFPSLVFDLLWFSPITFNLEAPVFSSEISPWFLFMGFCLDCSNSFVTFSNHYICVYLVGCGRGWDRVPCCAGTCYVDQTNLKLTEIRCGQHPHLRLPPGTDSALRTKPRAG